MDHSIFFYLMDRDNNILDFYGSPTPCLDLPGVGFAALADRGFLVVRVCVCVCSGKNLDAEEVASRMTAKILEDVKKRGP